MNKAILKVVSISILLVVGFVSCKKNVESVFLDNTTLTLRVGDTATLVATVSPDNAEDKSISWSSSDATVASVANGQIIALKTGSAIITVTTTDGGKTAQCFVTVSKQAPSPYFRIRVQDAITGSGIADAGMKLYDVVNFDKTLAIAHTGDDGLTYIMKMDYGKAYYIEEYSPPPGYSPFYPCYAKFSVDINGNIEILDSKQMLPNLHQDNTGTWIFTFINHKD